MTHNRPCCMSQNYCRIYFDITFIFFNNLCCSVRRHKPEDREHVVVKNPLHDAGGKTTRTIPVMPDVLTFFRKENRQCQKK